MVRSVRVTYRRRHSYATKSNRVTPVKTPGGKLVVHYKKKRNTGQSSGGVKCGDCGTGIRGVKHMRPYQYKLLKQRERHVTRAYGGTICHSCVRSRILRAYIIEEQKLVKQVLQEKPRKH